MNIYKYEGNIYYCINNNWYDGFLNKVNYLKKIDLDEEFPNVRQRVSSVQIIKTDSTVTLTDKNTNYLRTADLSKSADEWASLGTHFFNNKKYGEAFSCYWNAVHKCIEQNLSAKMYFPMISKCNRKLGNPQDAIVLFKYLMDNSNDDIIGNHAFMTSIAGAYADMFEITHDYSYLDSAFNASNVALFFQKTSADTASEYWKNNRARLNMLKDLYQKNRE